MDNNEYDALKARIQAGEAVQVGGRTAATVAELDFLRSAKPVEYGAGGISVLDHGITKDAADPGANSAAFTPEYVQETSPEDGSSATQVTSDQAPASDAAGDSDANTLPDDLPHVERLRAAGVTTRAQLEAMSREDLLALPGIGDARLTEIAAALGANR